jgi:hypothetical protein
MADAYEKKKGLFPLQKNVRESREKKGGEKGIVYYFISARR